MNLLTITMKKSLAIHAKEVDFANIVMEVGEVPIQEMGAVAYAVMEDVLVVMGKDIIN